MKASQIKKGNGRTVPAFDNARGKEEIDKPLPLEARRKEAVARIATIRGVDKETLETSLLNEIVAHYDAEFRRQVAKLAASMPEK